MKNLYIIFGIIVIIVISLELSKPTVTKQKIKYIIFKEECKFIQEGDTLVCTQYENYIYLDIYNKRIKYTKRDIFLIYKN